MAKQTVSLAVPGIDELSFTLFVPADCDVFLFNHPGFRAGCEIGFSEFWHEYKFQPNRMIWERCVQHFVSSHLENPYDLEATPLPWTAGYIYGWLSGVASYVDVSLSLPAFCAASSGIARFLSLRSRFPEYLQRHALGLGGIACASALNAEGEVA